MDSATREKLAALAAGPSVRRPRRGIVTHIPTPAGETDAFDEVAEPTAPCSRRDYVVQEYRYLKQCGVSDHQIAAQLCIELSTLQTYLKEPRAKQHA